MRLTPALVAVCAVALTWAAVRWLPQYRAERASVMQAPLRGTDAARDSAAEARVRTAPEKQLRDAEPAPAAQPAFDVEYAGDGAAVFRLQSQRDGAPAVAVLPSALHPHDVQITAANGLAEATVLTTPAQSDAPTIVALPADAEGLGAVVDERNGTAELTVPETDGVQRQGAIAFEPNPEIVGQATLSESTGTAEAPATSTREESAAEAVPFAPPPGVGAVEPQGAGEPGVVRTVPKPR